eukprot:190937_1
MSHSKHGSVNKIDCLLAQYYIAMGRNDYFDNDGIGKFKLFCGHEESNVIDNIEALNQKDEKQSDYDSDESFEFRTEWAACTIIDWLDIDDQF